MQDQERLLSVTYPLA
jgi:pimeloyl-ACP methyl ester carboxylesterase